MDIIITAVGEFIWTASCAVVNFCISSGVSVIAVFVSFLCAILASAFYKYSTHQQQQMSYNDIPNTLNNKCEDDELDKPTTETTDASLTMPLLPMTSVDVTIDGNTSPPATVSEIEINVEENINENGHENGRQENEHEQTSDDILIDTIEGSEEEIQKQQIANIYRLLNDQHLINNWTTTDFLDQLKMYGLHGYDEDETESSSP